MWRSCLKDYTEDFSKEIFSVKNPKYDGNNVSLEFRGLSS